MPQPEPSLSERFEALNEATSRRAAQLAAQGKTAHLWAIVCTPGLVFLRAYVWRGGWRHGMAGFVEALFAAYEVFVSRFKLWELHQAQKP